MGILTTLNTLAHGGVQQPDSYIKKKDYHFDEDVLGRGTFGYVKHAIRVHDGLPVAIKVIPKRLVKGHFDLVVSEINVLKNLNHPSIIRLHETFESREKFYMVFELATGGELFERLSNRGKFSEKDASAVIRSVLRGLEYLHSKNIIHRDIKPENLLFKNQKSDAELVICDFGIAKEITGPTSMLDTLCGSPLYVAPEVLERKPYGCAVDIWAMGVIAYMLLSGYQPFQQGQDPSELTDQITHAKYEFHERYWQDISSDAKDFVRWLLSLDPKERPTAAQALRHRWILTGGGSDVKLRTGGAAKSTKKASSSSAAATNATVLSS